METPLDRMLRIGIYSPDSTVKTLLASALKADYRVRTNLNRAALNELLTHDSEIDVLVVDFDSNRSSLDEQLAFYAEIADGPVPIVVMTDDMRRSTAMEFLRRGAFDCIRKPPSLIEFRVIVGRAYEQAQMKAALRQRESAIHSKGCDQLLGVSAPAAAMYDLIGRVANLAASVLITGESGTGKELVARAIHNTGSRAGQPFVAVSCGAIPETLIEAELFGHERGAYTGSTASRAGHFEQVGNGTLFLDEIGELSPAIQVKLLRVLQQREFSRLGSNRLVPLNARIVFATHRDLEGMCNTGAFRRDLFYRVNVMNIHVPPLRERTGDIPLLAMHFLRQYSAEYGKTVHDIRPNAMELLVDYDWPGNVRELENVIQGAVIRTNGASICQADLPEALQPAPEAVAHFDCATFDDLLRQFKIDLINRTVESCQGNKTLAARKLGLSRAYLHRLIREASSANPLTFPETA
jgi:DNA-binding NtrC family response regulator